MRQLGVELVVNDISIFQRRKKGVMFHQTSTTGLTTHNTHNTLESQTSLTLGSLYESTRLRVCLSMRLQTVSVYEQ